MTLRTALESKPNIEDWAIMLVRKGANGETQRLALYKLDDPIEVKKAMIEEVQDKEIETFCPIDFEGFGTKMVIALRD